MMAPGNAVIARFAIIAIDGSAAYDQSYEQKSEYLIHWAFFRISFPPIFEIPQIDLSKVVIGLSENIP